MISLWLLFQIEEIDLLPQFLYNDYKWLIDFSFCAAVINGLVEIFAFLLPEIYTQELNLGWCGTALSSSLHCILCWRSIIFMIKNGRVSCNYDTCFLRGDATFFSVKMLIVAYEYVKQSKHVIKKETKQKSIIPVKFRDPFQ